MSQKIRAKKITDAEVQKGREEVLRKIAEYKKKVNAEFRPVLVKYLKENNPVKKGRVYEIKEGTKRRGYKRFVVYGSQLSFLDWSDTHCSIMIRVGGWWLDENNVPAVWDDRTVHGIGNPTLFTLSTNQDHHPVPKHLMGRGR